MSVSRLTQIAGLLVFGYVLVPAHIPVRAQNDALPQGATRCDPSIPISIELTPLNQPALGRPTRFGVTIVSRLDPDLIQDMQLLYELPARVRMTAQAGAAPPALRKSGRTDLELGVMLPDRSRYPIRARLVVLLANGKTISQTAVRWAGLSGEDQPEGMIGRITDPDGTGIRVYRGETIKEQP
jgi:hypothetical protein